MVLLAKWSGWTLLHPEWCPRHLWCAGSVKLGNCVIKFVTLNYNGNRAGTGNFSFNLKSKQNTKTWSGNYCGIL